MKNNSFIPHPAPWKVPLRGRGSITLPMFRRFLFNCGVFEDGLSSTIHSLRSHHTSFLQIFLERESGSEDDESILSLACRNNTDINNNNFVVPKEEENDVMNMMSMNRFSIPRCWRGSVLYHCSTCTFPLPSDFQSFLLNEEGEFSSCTFYLGLSSCISNAKLLWKAYKHHSDIESSSSSTKKSGAEMADPLLELIVKILESVRHVREDCIQLSNEVNLPKIEGISEEILSLSSESPFISSFLVANEEMVETFDSLLKNKNKNKNGEEQEEDETNYHQQLLSTPWEGREEWEDMFILVESGNVKSKGDEDAKIITTTEEMEEEENVESENDDDGKTPEENYASELRILLQNMSNSDNQSTMDTKVRIKFIVYLFFCKKKDIGRSVKIGECNIKK